MKITEELIEERIDKYISDNESEILADIDNRISKAVDKNIREYFSGYNWNKSDTLKYIEGKIETLANEQASIAEVDVDEIQRLVNRKITQQVKKISVKMGD